MLSAQSEVDTPAVRVTRWRVAPGSVTCHHIRETDSIIVPVTSGETTIVAAGGERSKAQLVLGNSCFRRDGLAHDVLKASATDIVFPAIELK